MAEKTSGLLGDIEIPKKPPYVPEGAIVESLAALSGITEAVFMPWIEDRIKLIWLDSNDDRLGMTRFEEGSGELNRRKRLRLDPGEVTIGLHPALLEDEMLYKHTFVHEFLHASGLTLHSKKHDELTKLVKEIIFERSKSKIIFLVTHDKTLINAAKFVISIPPEDSKKI